MAKLSFCIIPSRANSDGSHYIRLKITSKNTTAYIITRYKIEKAAHWKEGKIVKHPDAEFNNRKLREVLAEYENILDEMPNPNVTATEVKAYLETHVHKSDSLRDYAEAYITRLKKEDRKSYATSFAATVLLNITPWRFNTSGIASRRYSGVWESRTVERLAFITFSPV